jgi:hypothetical protein
MEYNCNKCNKKYSSYQTLWTHNKKFHTSQPTQNSLTPQPNPQLPQSDTKLKCIHCNNLFSRKDNLKRHEKICKNKDNVITTQNNELELEKMKQTNIQLEEIINKLSLPMNNQLINIIEDKNKKIVELNNQLQSINIENIEQVVVNQQITQINSLTFNDVVIISRSEDNYINATQLCQVGNKKFNHWYCLDSTKQLINALESKAGITALELIEVNKGGAHLGSWIHPDLAIQLAQWISPIFALQVSEWIRTLFTDGKVEIKLQNELKIKDNELKIKDNKIKLLENTYLKKHKRENYSEENVIYIVSTDENIKNRNYIIGKAHKLKNRLSTYNKTAEHQVIYYKHCKNEDTLNIVESIILNKLKDYKEQANRDRFILPLEKDITFFINVIDEAIEFLN